MTQPQQLEQQPNNEQIIDRLLWEQHQSEPKDILSPDKQLLITSSRVVGIRFRIYMLLMLILIVIFGSYFVFPAWDVLQGVFAELQTVNLQIEGFQTKKLQMDADKALIAKIESGSDAIISCLNERVGCQSIDQSIRNNFSFARSYIQLNNLSDPKMFINEKVLLANINDYLLKGSAGSRNGTINKIDIGDTKEFFGNLSYVPLKLTITFNDKDALLSFVDNVEKKVLSHADYRVLYKIDNISYDIANYTTKQNVEIDLNAYYYTN
jgi:hypothetical protein